MDVNLYADSVAESRCARSFSVRLSGFMNKVIKLLLTDLVGQCRNILSRSLFRILLPSVGQYGKGRR